MKYRTRNASEVAPRVLRRGDKLRVRFVTDVWPARVVRATRKQAIANLYDLSGRLDGEVLIQWDPKAEAQVNGATERGLWRLCGVQSPDPVDGLVFNGNQPS